MDHDISISCILLLFFFLNPDPPSQLQIGFRSSLLSFGRKSRGAEVQELARLRLRRRRSLQPPPGWGWVARRLGGSLDRSRSAKTFKANLMFRVRVNWLIIDSLLMTKHLFIASSHVLHFE